jgi:hypothetical protein
LENPARDPQIGHVDLFFFTHRLFASLVYAMGGKISPDFNLKGAALTFQPEKKTFF